VVIASDDDFFEDGVGFTASSRVTFTAPHASVYVVEASSFQNRYDRGVGTYHLIVN
jgi:hypothetical protein